MQKLTGPPTPQRCESGGCIQVDDYTHGDGYLRVHSTITGTVMQCTPAEFAVFRDDVKAGRYDHVGNPVRVLEGD